MMENLNKFQQAVKKYGVPDLDVFQSVDLVERRNVPQVTQCIMALGRSVRYDIWFWNEIIIIILNFIFESVICTQTFVAHILVQNQLKKTKENGVKSNYVLEKPWSTCNMVRTRVLMPAEWILVTQDTCNLMARQYLAFCQQFNSIKSTNNYLYQNEFMQIFLSLNFSL